MTWTLFLDDLRFPDDVRYNYGPYKELVICRSMDDAVWAVKQYGLPAFVSFDHDLADVHYNSDNGEKTGLSFAKWICDYIMDNNVKYIPDFAWHVHSANPVGAANIESYMTCFNKHWKTIL